MALEIVAAFSISGFLDWASAVWAVLPFGSQVFTALGMLLPAASLLAAIAMIASAVTPLRGRQRIMSPEHDAVYLRGIGAATN